MPESEQAEFRRHLAELRHAASGLGGDIAKEISDLDTKIERFGSAAAREAGDLGSDIRSDFLHLGRTMDEELRRLPHRISGGAMAIGSGTARAAGAARDAMVDAGHKAKVGTRNALAAAAGVKRTPMRGWSPPDPPSDDGPRDG